MDPQHYKQERIQSVLLALKVEEMNYHIDHHRKMTLDEKIKYLDQLGVNLNFLSEAIEDVKKQIQNQSV